MKKLIASVLSFTLTVSMIPITAVAAEPGRISGIATISGKPHAYITLRLRNLDTGLLLAKTTSNADGQFSFSAPATGFFVIESVTNDGTILGTSSVISLKPNTLTPDVTVRSSGTATGAARAQDQAAGAGAAGAGGGSGLTATAIALVAVGFGLGVTTGVVVAKNDASPSQ